MKTNELKASRIKMGYTQKDVAKFLDLSNVTYRHKEKKELEFKLSEVVTLAKVLNLKNEEIFNIFFEND